MGLKLGEIFVDVKARTSGLRKGLMESRRQVNKFGSALAGLKGPLLAFGAAGAALGAGLVFAFKKASDAAGIQERAVNKLAISLRNAGDASQEALEDQLAFAASIQQVTSFGDEAVIELQSLIASFGATGDVLKEATRATLDFATVQGVDLKAAAILVGKAFVGETGTLSRYGIIIDKNIPKSQKFEAVLEALNKQFGGAAAAGRQTTIGQLKALSNAFGDLQESVGKVVNTAIRPLAANLAQTITAFLNNRTAVAQLQSGLANFIATIVIATRAIRSFGADTITVFNAIQSPVDRVKESFESLVQGFATSAAKVAAFAAQGFRSTAGDAAAAAAGILSTQIALRDLDGTLLAATTGVETFKDQLAATREELGLTPEGVNEAVLAIEQLNEAQALAAEQEKVRSVERSQRELTKREEMKLEQEARSQLNAFSAKSDTAITALFNKNLSVRQKQQKLFAQTSSTIQGLITKGLVNSLAKQVSASRSSGIAQSNADKPAIASGFFKAFSGLPFGIGQALALAATATAFAFIGRLANFQRGGLVPGTDTGRDTVPALLRPGEIVLPNDIVSFLQRVGIPVQPTFAPAGGGAQTNILNINNPVIDSDERLQDLTDQVGEAFFDRLTLEGRIAS